ncbi:MAG: LacI family transcriptional regulator [Peptococcaceae bacterium]|jgi:LacI family transcriptional regulator|nr:LacI family transcriptional regulator [Peptococcaceae bacterium]
MRKVTIKDIAKAVGVSYSTVSRSLSKSPEISLETREKVLAACREYGYTANYVAKSMVMGKTEIIGLIVSSMDNPFMSELSDYIERYAREKGYNLMVCTTSHNEKQEDEVFRLLVGRQVDGIIFFPSFSTSYDNLKPFIDGVPTVFMSENLRDLPESYIAVDNREGTRLGTEYLHRLNHRKILYFGRRKHSTTHQLRAQGYMDACRELGMEPSFMDSDHPFSSIQKGYALARELFARPLAYTAVAAATDSLAIGMLQAAGEAGVRIPEDLSLLGFDDIIYAGLPVINLTTIRQPKEAMATTAVDMLLDRINNPMTAYSHIILAPSLVERGSCQRLSCQNN